MSDKDGMSLDMENWRNTKPGNYNIKIMETERH